MDKENIQINEPTQSSRNIWLIIIVVVITALIIGSGVYVWQRMNLKTVESNLQNEIIVLEKQIKNLQQIIDSTNQNSGISTENDDNNQNKKETELSLTSLDQIWDLYTNNKYGFSIKVPKKMFHSYGLMCEWKTDSYRPKTGLVPVKIFEDKSIFITSEYFYELTGETVKDNKHYYSGCEKIINSIANLKDNRYYQQQSWELIIKDIYNDNELEKFIQERYGSGCQLGSKISSAQEGVYDIAIKKDGKDFEESNCPINYITVLKYYPEKNKVISWHRGQVYTFMGDGGEYDQEMVDSFKFK